ncbi:MULTISPECIES: ArsR/SmtB family transcription factor [Paenibacillus]|uniref:Transcriptional regulator n=2 Tax=Paenibacillus TaxID=44249 RepID=A0A1R1EPT3_9BACL|nr:MULTISPECIES: winged helix-turn-helix domain-containing protein [Paenibacillus]OMF53811.1 transcriptional regulator [Paenibacillus rhizosphaerae]GIO54878.1 hypothetical protein J21TS7_31960 [Paenibacillus cineris]
MDYRIDIKFEPVHEFMNSLHTYICRASYKKIDLSPSWATATKKQLKPEFAAMLDEMLVNGDWWSFAYLLGLLVPEGRGVEGFLDWLENLTIQDLVQLFTANGNEFPDEDLEVFLARTRSMFEQWYEQYFRNVDPAILQALEREKEERLQQLTDADRADFVDETTNGMLFKPVDSADELVLIPQYHFQPVNMVTHYGRKIYCHYNSRIYLGDDDYIPTHDLRMIRSLGEKSRLKILRFLHGGPRTFTEIVSHVQLSKGITHDHISKLRTAGLIYAHFEGENLTEYSLRKRAIHQMQERLLGYIEEG